MLPPTAVGVVPNDQSTISGCLLQSYEDIGQAAFGSKGRAFITWVLYTELIGTCALFYILEVSAQAGEKDCCKLRRGHSWRAVCTPQQPRLRPALRAAQTLRLQAARPALRPALLLVTPERHWLRQQQPVSKTQAAGWHAAGCVLPPVLSQEIGQRLSLCLSSSRNCQPACPEALALSLWQQALPALSGG